jgi:hypothetical protein
VPEVRAIRARDYTTAHHFVAPTTVPNIMPEQQKLFSLKSYYL